MVTRNMNLADKMNRPLPVRFSPIPKDRLLEIQRDFPYTDSVVQGNPGGFVSVPRYAEVAEELYNLPVRSDDCWVVTFPKCGTTWTQELVWLVANNCDFQGAKKKLNERFPFLEIPYIRRPSEVELLIKMGHYRPNIIQALNTSPSPRFIKSHLPLYLLPPDLLETSKVIYVARNPKDVIVSYFYHYNLLKTLSFEKDIETFAKYFMRNEAIIYAPFFPHVLEAWAKKDHPNLLFLFYEDMKKDIKTEIKKVAAFLNKDLNDQQLQQLAEHLHFQNFSQNNAVNNESLKDIGILNKEGHFVRKGIVGDWKNHFTPEMTKTIDEWIERNLTGTDLVFEDELSLSNLDEKP